MYSNFINYIRIGEKMNAQLKDLQMQIDKELKQKKILNKFNQDFQKLVLDKGKTYKGYAEYYKTLAILWIVIASQMAIIILFLTDIL
jgi:sensor domain CHASE-containing protein